ncbi:hypothetical protein [Streptomyces atratus]|uniref:hypothetical protein n=1 Tax=Streptomyces atratus TaxID=1893 RepID=UPI003395A455
MTDFLPAAAAHVVRIVLVADPGVASEIAQELAAKLSQLLRRRVGADVDWRVTARTVPLVADEQLDVSSAADVVRPLLPEGDWEAGVLLTDLPRRAGLRPVSVEVSPADRIALVSLPALGSWRMRRRARRVVADVVGMLTRERADLAPSLEEAGRLEASGAGEDGLERFIVPGLRGHLSASDGRSCERRRRCGLFATLSRALAGVFATAAFGLINNSTWTLSDSVVVSSLTSVVNVAQLMRRKDMGAVLVVADDQLRGLVADRERLVHRARYRFSPGRHQRCRAKRVHDGLGVTCPWTPVRDGPMQRIRTAVNARPMVNYDLLASNGVSRHDLAVTTLGRVRGRSTVTVDLAVAYHAIVIGRARRSAAPILPRPRNESGSCERP